MRFGGNVNAGCRGGCVGVSRGADASCVGSVSEDGGGYLGRSGKKVKEKRLYAF